MPQYLGTADKVVIKSFREIYSSPIISSNTLTLDLGQSSLFSVLLNSNIFTMNVINIPPSSQTFNFTLIFTADGITRAVKWPTAFIWPDGNIPTITSNAIKKDVFNFSTTNGGTTWYGFVGGQNI